METYESIRDRYLVMTKVWGANRGGMPVFKTRQDDGSFHIEIDNAGIYALISTERGSVFEHKKTQSLDELLYWIARIEANGRGLAYEFRHRNSTDDSRRVYFSKAEEELAHVIPEWGERLHSEHLEILKCNPFRDDPFNELQVAES